MRDGFQKIFKIDVKSTKILPHSVKIKRTLDVGLMQPLDGSVSTPCSVKEVHFAVRVLGSDSGFPLSIVSPYASGYLTPPVLRCGLRAIMPLTWGLGWVK